METSTNKIKDVNAQFRFVRLIFLKRHWHQIPPKDRLLGLNSNSTFEDIQRELFPEHQDQWTVLQTTFGPVPYWTKPEATSRIGSDCQTLYAVDRDAYVLALVRNSESDYPIVLSCNSLVQGGAPLCDIIASLTPDLALASVMGYSTAMRGDTVGWLEEQKNKWHFPTVFILTTSERPDRFEFTAEPAPKPLSLQLLYRDSKRLLQRSHSIKYCALQMIHVSKALTHAVLSLSKLLDTPGSVGDDAKNLEDVVSSISRAKMLEGPCSLRRENPEVKVLEKAKGYYPYRLVALTISENLDQSYYKLAEILEDLESESVISASNEVASNLRRLFESRIEKVFLELCGELPGAVTIRDSHARFQKMKQWDEEEAKEDEEKEMRRLAQMSALEMGALWLKRVWHILFTREEPKSSWPPMPPFSIDEALQDLQTGTPSLRGREFKDQDADVDATLDPATNVY